MALEPKTSLLKQVLTAWRRAARAGRAQRQHPLAYVARVLANRVRGVQPRFRPERGPRHLVSVMLPVGGAPHALEATARSVLDGSHDALELILLEGGTASGPIEDVLVRLSANPRVRRLAVDRVAAVLAARGEFVAWLSADYLLSPAAIATLVARLLETPEAELAFADVASATAVAATDVVHAFVLCRRRAVLLVERLISEDPAPRPEMLLQVAGGAASLHVRAAVAQCIRLAPSPGGASKPPGSASLRPSGQRPDGAEAWTLLYDEALEAADRHALEVLGAELPAVVRPLSAAGPVTGRSLQISGAGGVGRETVVVRALPQAWQLAWRRHGADEERSLTFWRGASIPAVAAQARSHRRTGRRDRRRLVGCHLAQALELDDVAARGMITRSDSVRFAFLDVPENEGRGRALMAGLDNAVYLGARPFGAAPDLYELFDFVWVPPGMAQRAGPGTGGGTAERGAEAGYRLSLALAYAIGRPLLVPRDLRPSAAPHQYLYDVDESLAFVADLAGGVLDADVLDRYLSLWTPTACLRALLRVAAVLPGAEASDAPRTASHRAGSAAPRAPSGRAVGGPLRLLLASDGLDTGGLEEIVAQLASHLPRLGAEPAVLCVRSGGATATRLAAQGVPVFVAHGEPRAVREILRRQRPDVINSHFAGLELLEAAGELGIPVVETIQNTYVWFDRERWQLEARRSRHFTRAAPVSSLVRTYYAKWNRAFSPEWMSVVPNLVAPERLPLVERSRARRELGISDADVVFLNLASYATQKNQLGLLTAFDDAARREPRLRLLCAGRVAEAPYHERLLEHRLRLGARARIELHAFRRDTATLLSACDVFVLDSFFEGWSVAATEALVAGRPVLLADCGGARELVGERGERGVLVPNPAGNALDLDLETLVAMVLRERQPNTPALAEAFLRMAEDCERWRRIGDEIATHARERFGFDASARRYFELFEAALGRR